MPIDLAHSTVLKRRRSMRVAIVLGALVLASTACGEGTTDKADAPVAPATPTTPGPTVAEARAALTRYVDALGAGRIDDAMAARCEPARVKPEDLAQFTDQARTLLNALAPVTVDSVGKADPPSGLQPVADIAARTEIVYRLAVKGVPSRGELRTVVVREGGETRLCGFATGMAKALHEGLPKEVADMGATARDLVELMPAGIGGDYRQIVDDAGTSTRPNMIRSWTRAWQRPDNGGATVTAAKYRITPSASTDAAMLNVAVASDGVEQFPVRPAPQAVGIRFLGYAWLWIQPPDQGPFVDQAAMRFGDKVVIASVANPPVGTGHDAIDGVVSEIVRLARS